MPQPAQLSRWCLKRVLVVTASPPLTLFAWKAKQSGACVRGSLYRAADVGFGVHCHLVQVEAQPHQKSIPPVFHFDGLRSDERGLRGQVSLLRETQKAWIAPTSVRTLSLPQGSRQWWAQYRRRLAAVARVQLLSRLSPALSCGASNARASICASLAFNTLGRCQQSVRSLAYQDWQREGSGLVSATTASSRALPGILRADKQHIEAPTRDPLRLRSGQAFTRLNHAGFRDDACE